MKTKKIWANLAVTDLERTTKFYTHIGFKPNGSTKELTSFTVGDDKFIIHFFLKEFLEPAVKGKILNTENGNETVFTLGAESQQAVDQWERAVTHAGGNIISTPEEFGHGYYGFVFTDPDGHRFNVFYMEGL